MENNIPIINIVESLEQKEDDECEVKNFNFIMNKIKQIQSYNSF